MYNDTMKDKDRTQILLENIRDDFIHFAEVQDGMNERLKRVEIDVIDIKNEVSDYPIAKRVVAEHTDQILDLQKQVALA